MLLQVGLIITIRHENKFDNKQPMSIFFGNDTDLSLPSPSGFSDLVQTKFLSITQWLHSAQCTVHTLLWTTPPTPQPSIFPICAKTRFHFIRPMGCRYWPNLKNMQIFIPGSDQTIENSERVLNFRGFLMGLPSIPAPPPLLWRHAKGKSAGGGENNQNNQKDEQSPFMLYTHPHVALAIILLSF